MFEFDSTYCFFIRFHFELVFSDNFQLCLCFLCKSSKWGIFFYLLPYMSMKCAAESQFCVCIPEKISTTDVHEVPLAILQHFFTILPNYPEYIFEVIFILFQNVMQLCQILHIPVYLIECCKCLKLMNWVDNIIFAPVAVFSVSDGNVNKKTDNFFVYMGGGYWKRETFYSSSEYSMLKILRIYLSCARFWRFIER